MAYPMETVPNIISRGKFKGSQDIRYARCATAWKHKLAMPKCENCQYIPYFLSCLSQCTYNRQDLHWDSSVKLKNQRLKVDKNSLINGMPHEYKNSTSNSSSNVFKSKHWNWDYELETLIEEMSELNTENPLFDDPLYDTNGNPNSYISYQNDENDDQFPVSLSESAAKTALQNQRSYSSPKLVTRKPSMHQISDSKTPGLKPSSIPRPIKTYKQYSQTPHTGRPNVQRSLLQTTKSATIPRSAISSDQNQSWSQLFQGLHQRLHLQNARQSRSFTNETSNRTFGNFGFKLSQKFRLSSLPKPSVSTNQGYTAGAKNFNNS